MIKIDFFHRLFEGQNSFLSIELGFKSFQFCPFHLSLSVQVTTNKQITTEDQQKGETY